MNILCYLPTTLKVYLIALLILSVSSAQATEEHEILITPIKIGYYDFHDTITAIGQCKSEQSKTYYAKAAGNIDSISIIQGKNVSAGDVLITIDADIAKANKSKAEATLKLAKTTYERDLSLLQKKIISDQALNKSKVDLANAKLDLANTLSKYEDMIITAPYDGYVGVVNARVGDDIQKGDYLFSLIAKGDKTIFIELPENMNSKIDNNSLVHAKDSSNSILQGKIVAVSQYLNDSGTIDAKLAFPANSNLLHGSYIETEITFNQHKALAIPEKILLKNNMGNFIYKITEGNKVKQVYITTGTRTDNMIEIISDKIQVGDLLVLNGLTKVFDGATIKIINNSDKNQQQPEM